MMNYMQYMKKGDNFNPSQWNFNKVDKSKLTPEQIKYAVEQYFWRTKDPKMKEQYELWSNYQQNTNASQNANPISDIAAAAELPEVTITMAKPNYIDQIKADVRNKWANMSTEDKVHAGIDVATTIGGFIPGADIVADGVDLLHSLQRKDWTGAGVGAVAMALPFVSAPMLRKIKNTTSAILHPKRTKKAKAFAEELNKVIDESTIVQTIPTTPDNHIASMIRIEPKTPNADVSLLQRPKKDITDSEFAGMPKGERNQPKRQWLEGEITYDAEGNPQLYQVYGWGNNIRPSLPKKPVPKPVADAVNRPALSVLYNDGDIRSQRELRKQAMIKAYGKGKKPDDNLKATFDNIIADRTRQALTGQQSNLFSSQVGKEYIQPYIDAFRDYYRHLGIDLDDYTDLDLAKVLDNQYDYLTSMQTGKVKGLLYWHSGANWFDTFDPARRGSTRGHHDDDFAGSYFAQHPLYYSGGRNKAIESLHQQGINTDHLNDADLYLLGAANTQPYLFDRVQHILGEIPNKTDVELSEGLLGLGHNRSPNIVSGLEPTIVSQRISSLFPHPETANGQWFIRSFDDPRVNYKSGGTIHIKKKNKGKFTDYCGGKVTEECIRKGKNSSNPTTRKRANFAWVARHKFKHEEGGTINYLTMFNENN